MGLNISVANMVNTSTDKPKCGCVSWIAHYRQNTGKRGVIKCSVKNCSKNADVGAHVHIVLFETKIAPRGHFDIPKTYIIPFCYSHNNMRLGEDVFDIGKVKLIKAHECNRKNKTKHHK